MSLGSIPHPFQPPPSLDPPPYEDADEDDFNSKTLEPMTLVLAGHFIYEAFSSSSPLYRMNRGVASLSHSDTKVQLERLERTVKNSTGTPRVAERTRHIFDLTHTSSARGLLYNPHSLSAPVPPYYLHAVSRKTIGHVGLRKSHFRRRFETVSVDVSCRNKYNQPVFDKEAKPLFVVDWSHDRYEWTDGDGNPIAVEEDIGEGQYKLTISASLRRETMDALIGMWSLRLWHCSAEGKKTGAGARK